MRHFRELPRGLCFDGLHAIQRQFILYGMALAPDLDALGRTIRINHEIKKIEDTPDGKYLNDSGKLGEVFARDKKFIEDTARRARGEQIKKLFADEMIELPRYYRLKYGIDTEQPKPKIENEQPETPPTIEEILQMSKMKNGRP